MSCNVNEDVVGVVSTDAKIFIQTTSRTFLHLTHVLFVLSMELNSLIMEVGVVHREYMISKGRRREEREAF